MTSVEPAATRPWTAGTAVWTAVVTAGCALLGAALGALGLGSVDDDRTADLVLLLLAPAAAVAFAGARALARRRGRTVLLAGLAAIAALLTAAGILDTEMRTVGVGLTSWLFLCLGPPVLSAAFALAPSVGTWLSGRSVPVPPRPDAATTAAVLGMLTGIPLVLGGWVSAAEALREPAEDVGLWTAIPFGIALVVGARLLLDGRSGRPLAAAAAAAVVWAMATVAATPLHLAGVVVGLGLLLPLPVATLVAALRRPVRERAGRS